MDMKEKGMQKKMFIVIAAVAVVAVLALVLILALGRKDEAYRSIKIIELEGGVTIEREGVGVLAASSNMNLISGDAVKTEQNAYAVLQLDSDKYVMLAESGSMTVVAEGDEANGRTAIQLDSGSVLNEIQNPLSNGSSYDIVTPSATMSVRGTVFEVRKNGDDSTGNIEVLVYDGKVEVGLDGMESALYQAGEYTQFTADENPQFIVERTEITEEHLNTQFMERLEQINLQSRELNLGTVQLASAQTKEEVSEPQQTPATPEPSVAPAQTAAPVQATTPATSVPSASPAVTPKPVRTPASQSDAQAPSVAAPEKSPAVDNSESDQDEDEDVQPVQPTQNPGETDNGGNTGSNNGNTGSDNVDTGNNGGNTGSDNGDTGNNGGNSGSDNVDTGNNGGNTGSDNGDTGNNGGNTGSDNEGTGSNGGNHNSLQDFWKTYTIDVYQQNVNDYQQSVSDGNAAAKECTVIFYLPYIVKADGYVSTMRNDAPAVYSSVQVQAGSSLPAPEKEPEGKVNYSESSLHFVGWCLENGKDWKFDFDTVEADMCLYPIWRDDDNCYYFPVICRSESSWGYYYYCNSVKEGSSLGGITLPGNEGVDFKGWVRVNHQNAFWVATSTVSGAESLKASWSK